MLSVAHPKSAPKSHAVFEPLMDLQEAALVLGMHWKTLEIKARQRQVPAVKVGKRWRFRLSSLNNWLDDGIKSNTTDRAAVTRQEHHP
jgi:excisionase family DNA binding protein